MLARQTLVEWSIPHRRPNIGSEHAVGSTWCDSLTHNLFRATGEVDIRSIKETATRPQITRDQFECRNLVDLTAKCHAAQRQGGDPHPAQTETPIVQSTTP